MEASFAWIRAVLHIPRGGGPASSGEKKDAGWVNWPKPCVLVAL